MEEVELNDDLKQRFYTFIRDDERVTSLNTIKSYRFVAEKIFSNYDSLTKQSVRAIIRRYKSTNVKAVLTKLNDFFFDSDIDFNIRFLKGKRPPRKIPDILTKEELKIILDKMPKIYSVMISCIYNIGAGLRISELINLEWGDIKWEQLSLDNQIIEVLIKNSKRGKSRIVPIAKESALSLLEYANDVNMIGDSGVPEGGRIFNFGEDQYKKDLRVLDKELWEFEYVKHSYDWIMYNIFNKYFKLPNRRITPHSLRHSRATELITIHKVPIEKVKDWLGHSDISTTMIYLHLGSSDDRELMGRIGGV